MDEEMRSHIEMQTRENIGEGMSNFIDSFLIRIAGPRAGPARPRGEQATSRRPKL